MARAGIKVWHWVQEGVEEASSIQQLSRLHLILGEAENAGHLLTACIGMQFAQSVREQGRIIVEQEDEFASGDLGHAIVAYAEALVFFADKQ